MKARPWIAGLEGIGMNDDGRSKEESAGEPRTLHALRWNRLKTRLDELRGLLDFTRSTTESGASAVLENAESSLKAAENALDVDKQQRGWRHCHQAYRFLLAGMDRKTLESRRRALRREAEEKLNNWRKEALLDIIGRDVDRAGDEISPEELATAQDIMDQHFANMYFKLEAAGIGLRPVPWMMGFLTLFLVIISVWSGFIGKGKESGFFLFDPTTTLIVLASGAVGAALSNTLTVMGRSARIPEYIGELRSWFIRLPVGALSAFALVALVQSGILPFPGIETPYVFAWAVAAGFSDQLLNKVIDRLERKAET